MLIPIFYFEDSWINDAEPKIIALIGISLIIFSNTESSALTKILSLKIVSIIGLSSYSIYLLHQPIFALFRIYKSRILENYLNNNTEILNYELISLLLVLFLLGFLNYEYIEKYYKKKCFFKILIGIVYFDYF